MVLIIIVVIINITQISEEEITRIFKEIDKDESGSITKKEAVRACRRSSSFPNQFHQASGLVKLTIHYHAKIIIYTITIGML